jgi:hypothetical protein
MMDLRPYRKGIVAGIGGAAMAATAIWGPDTTAGQVAILVVAALTAAGVYGVKNAPLPRDGEPG